MLATGDELASAASKALGQELRFEDIPEYVKIALFIIVYTYKAWANNIPGQKLRESFNPSQLVIIRSSSTY